MKIPIVSREERGPLGTRDGQATGLSDGQSLLQDRTRNTTKRKRGWRRKRQNIT